MRGPLPLQQLPRRIALLSGKRQKKMLCRNILVFESLSFIKGPFQNVVQRLAHVLLRETLHFGQPRHRALNLLIQCFTANPQARQQRRHHAVGLRHQRRKQMHGLNLLILVACRHIVGLLQRFLRFHRHLVKSQHDYLASRKRADALASPGPTTTVLLAYFPPAAAAATAGAPTFTLICFSFASSRFGIVSVSTPF
jgi:hypothetical protein